jgi:hypothetical protein
MLAKDSDDPGSTKIRSKMPTEWNLKPGQALLRRELHDEFGGGRQGGMEPSQKTPNVFLFTSTAGAAFGYDFDGWHPDGTFHYTGEGQLGDQVMSHGNRATRDHIAEGRSLRLFEKLGTSVTYIGEFTIPDESHLLIDEAPDAGKQKRAVFVFRLKPLGDTWVGVDHEAPTAEFYQSIPLEASNVELYVQQRSSEETVAVLRKEALLVQRYVTWLAKNGLGSVNRQSIPTAAGHLMYTDLYVPSSGELVEAKASSSREHIRLALGQILDYARYVDHATLGILTPTRPASELVELLTAHGIFAIWETKVGTFERLGPDSKWAA